MLYRTHFYNYVLVIGNYVLNNAIDMLVVTNFVCSVYLKYVKLLISFIFNLVLFFVYFNNVAYR